MHQKTLTDSQVKPTSQLEVTIVHGSLYKSDRDVRARALSLLTLEETTQDRLDEILNLTIDKVIIFSWGKTMGKDSPSEARKMYDVFVKRLKVLDGSNRIPWGVSFPEETEWLSNWNITIGDRDIAVYMEEESVDTEDNAEKSAKIIREIVDDKAYDKLVLSPLSSDFHIRRIKEIFKRHTQSWIESSKTFLIAENILKNAGGKYEKYSALKKKSTSPKTKLLEIVVQVVSMSEWGRKAVRKITEKRVEK